MRTLSKPKQPSTALVIQDKMIFSFLLATSFLRHSGEISVQEWNFLMRHPSASSAPLHPSASSAPLQPSASSAPFCQHSHPDSLHLWLQTSQALPHSAHQPVHVVAPCQCVTVGARPF